MFSQTQRVRLTKLGVSAAQIGALERALPLARALLTPQARMRDVREVLRLLQIDIRNTLDRISALGKGAADRREAMARIVMLDENHVLQRCVQSLEEAEDLVRTALSGLGGQRRSGAAAITPIAVIERALVIGDVAELNHASSGEKRRSTSRARRFMLSSSPGSHYRDVVGICYEAMGQANTDPERALKAFVAAKRRSASGVRERIARSG